MTTKHKTKVDEPKVERNVVEKPLPPNQQAALDRELAKIAARGGK